VSYTHHMVDAATLLERLRARGWRVTPQRRAVAEVLTGDHVHLTADEVHARARGRLPEVSLATVYNTLGELVDMGEVLELRIGDGPARYDPNVHARHHHLVCTGCGALLDIQPAGVEQLKISRSQQNGYVIEDIDITFRGRCPECSKPSRSTPR
jgi:Fur family transcriptional regulator, stress-responsive regulator